MQKYKSQQERTSMHVRKKTKALLTQKATLAKMSSIDYLDKLALEAK